MSSSKSSFRSVVDKLIEESISSSDYMKKVFNNVATLAVEAKKITDMVLKMNDRLNQHEEIILRLLNQTYQQKPLKKEDFFSYPEKKKDPEKPN